MSEDPFPITNAAGQLFCMAQRSPDGSGVILKGKNCDISLIDLQMRAQNPGKFAPRNKKISNGKAPARANKRGAARQPCGMATACKRENPPEQAVVLVTSP